ncbi:electron transfer flavoprotein subunit beta/FixA family protein [Kineococcus sp. SYSU DK001]|uniref:electron transfer flavoprotein subunit beta/FixA family protein n=1 Tax=Kineococcus sp. SYSU DK001 TaxID=3383122 RepID=UPI003D7E0C3B
MKIAVLVKEVPDTSGDRSLDEETGLTRRGAGDVVLDEINERALELALAHAGSSEGTEVVALTMAPESAGANLRRALAMGAHSAVHVVDDDLAGADALLTATVLAAALRRGDYDLVVTGNQSTDGSGGVVPAMVAELLGATLLSGMRSVQITPDGVRGTRAVEGATQTVSAELPAVLSVTEAMPEGRFPSFKGIMAAKKKPYEKLTLADLGVDASPTATAASIMTAVAQRPPRAAGRTVHDDGTAARQLVDYLVEQRLV